MVKRLIHKRWLLIGLGLVIVLSAGVASWLVWFDGDGADQPKPRVSQEVDDLNSEAAELSGSGNIPDAIAKLDSYVNAGKGSNKEMSAVLQTRASYYLQQSKADSAISDLQQAAGLTPDDPRVFVTLGRVYLIKSDSEKAKEMFAKALQVFDESDKSSYELPDRSYFENLSQQQPSVPSGNLTEPSTEGEPR